MKLERSLTTTLGCLVLLAATAHAHARERTHTITIDDYFTIANVTGCVASPDGSHVAYTEMRWDEAIDRRNTDLWVVNVATKQRTRLTFDDATDGHPIWSPDGHWIYFQTSRERDGAEQPPWNGTSQVWRVAVGGGSIEPVTRVVGGIDDYQLSDDGDTIYYTTSTEHHVADGWDELRSRFGTLGYGHGVIEASSLHALDLETWRARTLVDENRVIGAFSVAPDERRIALITTPDNTLLSNEGWSRVEVLDIAADSTVILDDTKWRDEAPSPYGWIIEPCWSPDGDTLAFRVDFDGYPGEVFFANLENATPRIMKYTRPQEVSCEGQMGWSPDGRFRYLAEDHARKQLYSAEINFSLGTIVSKCDTPGDVVIDAFSYSRDGELFVLHAGLDHPFDIFSVDTTDTGYHLDRITNINPQVDSWKIPQIRIVRWRSPDGTDVEGILELPPDYQPGTVLPLIVEIHGGPTASTKYCFQYWIYGRTRFAANGWALFSPNYRGSTGYGDRFLKDLIQNKNNLDVQDILAGVEALVERGIADPDRMAVMGWSNGGYLTNCLITNTTRFKAASSGAGVFDTVMQWSIEDTPGHVINYSGGLPWEQAEKMHGSSPLYDIDKARTPTLIHVGENDPRVPVEHSRALHRALHHYLDVPAELIVYPGEGHGLTTLTHRRAKLEWDDAWFKRYVLTPSADGEAGTADHAP